MSVLAVSPLRQLTPKDFAKNAIVDVPDVTILLVTVQLALKDSTKTF
jgi:hypothetical protein